MLRSVIQYRPDACLDIIDSLSSNINNKSLIRLTLSDLFERMYSSLYKGIHDFSFVPGIDLAHIADFCLQSEGTSKHQIMLVDTTPFKTDSKKMTDKQKVYDASSKSEKPVCNGHNYSVVGVPIVAKQKDDSSWVPPMSLERVPSDVNAAEFGMKQISKVLNDNSIESIDKENPISIGDASYNSPKAIVAVSNELKSNLTHIARCKGGRVCYKSPDEAINKAGHPLWFGQKAKLNDDIEKTIPPDLTFVRDDIKKNGKNIVVTVSVWDGMVFRGQRDFEAHLYPFSLVKIVVQTPDGKKVYKRPLWLCIYGKNRGSLVFSMMDKIYQIRFLIEVLFKFYKQNFLFNHFKTSVTENAEKMSLISFLAYLQCFLCRELASSFHYPWEYNKKNKCDERIKSVTEVQHAFPLIMSELKNHKKKPKQRGKSPGRSVGQTIKKRKKSNVIIKRVRNKIKYDSSLSNLQPGIFEKLEQETHQNENSKKSQCQEQKITMEFRKETIFADSSVNFSPTLNNSISKSSYKNSTGPPG